MSQQSNLILGVDSGGTKTLALLAAVSHGKPACILGVGRAGPGNPAIGGVAAAAQAVEQAARRAIENAGQVGSPVRAAVVAQAGAANAAIRAQAQQCVERMGFADRVQVVPDYSAVIAAIPTPGPRAAVIAGTGSVAFFVNATGVVTSSGGWGHLLGDEGSGFAIGRRVLREALSELASQAPAAPCTELVLHALDAHAPAKIIPRVYQSDDHRRTIAAVARDVLLAAPENQSMRALLREEMADLAGVIARGWLAAGCCGKELPMVLAGGVLTRSRLARTLLLEELADLDCRPQQVLLLPEPATGCLLLASELVDQAGSGS
ncbi:MAG: hypothetical protein KDA37_16650 [Planctomycetales bacterium]|nr:hypothetical protein [Planctomycetales bacterium]